MSCWAPLRKLRENCENPLWVFKLHICPSLLPTEDFFFPPLPRPPPLPLPLFLFTHNRPTMSFFFLLLSSLQRISNTLEGLASVFSSPSGLRLQHLAEQWSLSPYLRQMLDKYQPVLVSEDETLGFGCWMGLGWDRSFSFQG